MHEWCRRLRKVDLSVGISAVADSTKSDTKLLQKFSAGSDSTSIVRDIADASLVLTETVTKFLENLSLSRTILMLVGDTTIAT